MLYNTPLRSFAEALIVNQFVTEDELLILLKYYFGLTKALIDLDPPPMAPLAFADPAWLRVIIKENASAISAEAFVFLGYLDQGRNLNELSVFI
jgi:hypothetical protein